MTTEIQYQEPLTLATNQQFTQTIPVNTQEQSLSLYVGDLSSDVNDIDLYSLFSQFGQVNSVKICRNKMTKKSLGYGYVNFNNQVDATKAKFSLNFHVLKGKAIRIMLPIEGFNNKIKNLNIYTLYVKGLPSSFDSKQLYEMFIPLGDIFSCKVRILN